MMIFGPKFEGGFFNKSREREKSKEFKGKKEIIFAESKKIKERAKDRIITSEEIEQILNKEKESKLYGYSSRIFVYPSGLILEFEPVFYGKSHIETFSGFYTCNLIIPEKYKLEGEQKLSNELIQKQLEEGKKLPLEPKILENTLSEKAKGKIPLNQKVGFVFSKEFAVGYYSPIARWIVLVDEKALEESERNIFPILHELGHIPYSILEDELIAASLQKDNKIVKYYEEFIGGASNFIFALRKDFKKIDSKIKNKIIETLKNKIGNSHEVIKKILIKEMKKAQISGDRATEKNIQSVLKSLLVFGERMADARAVLFARQLREKGINLGFETQTELIDFYKEALESYAKYYSDERFLTGFRKQKP
jgi:Zn-dependent peptidase ImmA (M78 family)